MGQHHLIRHGCLPVGLFIAGASAVLVLAGPAAAASSASPVPSVQTPTAAAPSTPFVSAVPSPVQTATTIPSPISTDPGSIAVPAGNALTGKRNSGTPWEPIALLGGGVLLLGAGGLAVARRR